MPFAWTLFPPGVMQIARLFLEPALIGVGFIAARRIGRRWRFFCYLILTILVIRFLLFGNPGAWALFTELLTPAEVGYREYDVMEHEQNKYELGPPPEFLAIGSSQIGAIFAPADSQRLELFSLAGMGPLDMELYRSWIAGVRPGHVILYLSEFDIARPPFFDVARFADVPLIELPSAWHALVTRSGKTEGRTAFFEVVLAQLFPEYKYSFISRGMTHGLLRPPEFGAAPEQPQATTVPILEQQVENLKKNMVEEPIPYNLALVADFIDYLHARGIGVIIVDGQYNPLGVTERNAELHRRVREALQSMASAHHAMYIPRDDVLEFTEADFVDGYHVRPSAARRFVDRLLRVIDARVRDVGTTSQNN